LPIADTILFDVRTTENERVNIALVGSRIAEVAPAGSLAHTSGPRTRVLDLGGCLVTPGLWDSHIHLYHWSQMRHQLQLAGSTGSREQLLAAVSAAPDHGDWLVGHGWNPGDWPEAKPPTRQELDQVTGDRPTLLWCSDLHSALANTAALAASGLLEGAIEVPGGLIERDAEGSPTGWLRELAANIARDAMPVPDDARMAELLLQAQAELHRLGITGICDQRIKNQDDGPRLFRLLRGLESQGRWQLRTNLNVAAHHLAHARELGLSTGFGSDRLRLGHLKVFADGTLGSLTARMLEPFQAGASGQDGRGLYLTPPEEMRETFRQGAEAGFSISVHAIGDEANRVCLDLFEELDGLGIPRPRVPHRLEHAQILDDADVGRFAPLNLAVSAQPGHLLDDRHGSERALGERARLCYRLGDLWRAGATLVFGTDAPVSEIDPRYGLKAAALRCRPGETAWFPEQRLPAAAIWNAYTVGAAKAAGWGDLIGPLAPGYRADLVIWRGDPLGPGEAEVTHTLVDGRLVYGPI
jgi:predicted amidohydrolase YtcJ